MVNQIKKFFRRRIWLRTVLQIFFFLLIAVISTNHTLAAQGKAIPFIDAASLHALCPFGGVVSIYQFFTEGTFVQKIHQSSFVLMVLVFILSILFGPVFCGWVCPFGSFQEWIGFIGKKIFRRKYNTFVPKKLDNILRYMRYLVLAWFVYATAVSGTLVFSEVDPYYALFQFWTGEVAIGAFIILGITMLGSLFVERPWCKYACPYGAVLGITNLFRVFQLWRSEALCKLDSACDINCPMNIIVSEKTFIRDHQCISCLECTSEAHCPVAGTVHLVLGGGK